MSRAQTKIRYAFLDVLRGVALVAMAIYHFGWDLAFFGYVDPISVTAGPWKIFARCIASSFLFLVGIGLVLAHDKAIRWNGFWKRWLKVAGAALIITVATYFATPDAFIFFGILHHIAFASLFGLLFLRFPWAALIALGVGWIIVAPYLTIPALDDTHMAWTGLQAQNVRSNDYVPVFPWFGVVLIGMGVSRWMIKRDAFTALERGGNFSQNLVGKLLGFLGRHSLPTYLVHQPILIGLIYVFSLILPAQIDEATVRQNFAQDCVTSCEIANSVAQCVAYCSCVEMGLDNAQLFTPVMRGDMPFTDSEPQTILDACNAEIFE